LQQNNLKKYAIKLEEAYDTVRDMIDQRKDRLTGKRSEYDRMITDISRQIGKIEDEMVAAERDFSFDADKLKKELSKLPALVERAKKFMDYERKEYQHFGKRKPIPYAKIEK
jgi:phage host-nuclease inhibitor protein Gam